MRELDPTSTCPPWGSVVLRHSPTGTAYQRWYSDGLFHGTDGLTLTFPELFHSKGSPNNTGVYLIYVPLTDEKP